MTPFRTGFGVDFHQLEEGRTFMLGGIAIPYHKGATGHSDADVLLHAICDALLGALALEDIGSHFPDTDPAYKDVDSKILLEKTIALVREQGYSLVNIDCSICLQAPKLRPHIQAMRDCIAKILNQPVSDISIKATTTEQMGFVGRGEGISAYATVLVSQ